ncbi:MAG: cytochrome P450 [Alphaproteobacteria bacterium]
MADDIALFGPEMLADPYSIYARLRAEDPVHWHEKFGAWILTRYDDVDTALREPRLSSTLTDIIRAPEDAAARRDMQALYTFVANSMVFADPPHHTRLRALVAKAFTARAVEALRPRVDALATELLDAKRAAGGMDAVWDFAFPFPIAVILALLGIPTEDRVQIKRWCDGFLVPFGRAPDALSRTERCAAGASGEALRAYVGDLVENARKNPSDGLVSALVRAAEGGDRLNADELFATIILLLIAGHENMTALLGCAVLEFARRPEQWKRLGEEPALMENAVEELLRYLSPNQFIRRRALDDMPLGGKTIRKGDLVFLILAAANRDPARFPDPDRLDIARPHARNVALGHGFHFCLGGALAKMETEIALAALRKRLPVLKLGPEPIEYNDNHNVRSLKGLKLVW